MAEEEKKEEIPFEFVPQGGEPTNTTKDYTGKGTAKYPNGEVYEGDYSEGVSPILCSCGVAKASTPTPTPTSTTETSKITASTGSAG